MDKCARWVIGGICNFMPGLKFYMVMMIMLGMLAFNRVWHFPRECWYGTAIMAVMFWAMEFKGKK